VGPGAAPKIAVVKKLKPIADHLGCTRAQLAIAWCVHNRHVSSAITGATRGEQMKENLGALDVLPKLTDSVMREIESLLSHAPRS
jgi:aryl-alcohol dehydrogenase-like predicted oxidoreductase